MERLSADIAIIGSGIGGATTALALSRKDADVLVLERGRRIPREERNWDARAIFIDGIYRPTERWYDRDGKAFLPGLHYLVGGNSKVYGASLPRFREQDFGAIEHLEGTSPAWPFSYADLEPYYAEAERIYNVHGTTGEDSSEPWRSGPFPYPAIEHEPYVADLRDRLVEKDVHPSSNSMGIDLREDGACIRCGTCDGFPCKLGAKSDAEVNALDPALATGRVRLETGMRVLQIETDATGRRVAHLIVDGPDGRVEVQARNFVLAAGSINSAALLLASADDKHPTGLANASDQVGRNFMMHNNAHLVCIDIDRRNDVVFQKTMSVNDWYHDGGDGYPLGSMQLIGKVQGSMMKSEARWAPLPLLDRASARSVEWLVMAEDLPDQDNRVVVDRSGRITTVREPRGMKTFWELYERARGLLRSVGYDVIFTQHFGINMNSHQCGTNVAGEDPATSVLDPWCKAHDLDNLWVVDGGFFPSSAAMNPALTIASQALRVVAESRSGQMTAISCAIDIAPLGPLSDPAAIVRLGRAAERSGWDGLSIWDGLGLSMGTTAADPFVALTAVAASTSRIRLITSVIAVARRRPQLVVQAAASLDRISGGRLVLGLGAGEDEADFTAFDNSFDRSTRIASMDEGIAIIDGLLRGEALDYEGEAFAVHGVAVGPRPLQQPRPPLWFGGMKPGALRRAAALDGWIGIGISEDGSAMELTPDRFGSMVRTIGEHRASLGREGEPYVNAILGYAGEPTAGTVQAFAAAGATWWLESLSPMRGSVEELEAVVERGPPR